MKNDWNTVKVADVTDYINRGIPPVYTQDISGTAVINQKCIRDGQVNFDLSRLTDESVRQVPQVKLIQPYDILVNSTGTGTVGRVGQVIDLAQRATVDSHVTIVRPNKDRVDPVYLGIWLKSKQEELEDLVEGSSNQVELSRDKISTIKIILPTLKAQKKIVAILTSIDEQINITDQIIHKIEQLKQGFMQSFFNVNNSKGKITTIENLGKFKRGPFGGALKKEIFVDKGFKVYEQKNAIYNDFSLGSYFIDSDKFEEMKGFSLKSGDIIISCSGTLGKVAIVPAKFQKGIINQALLKITPSKEWNVLYVKYLLESSYVQERFIQVAPGSAMKNMAAMNVIKSTKIIKPLLKEQQRISKIISAIDSNLYVELNYKNALSTIKNGLFQDIFNQEIEIH